MAQHSFSWIGPLSFGAVLMFLLDPGNGRRRRALLRDRTTRLTRRTGRMTGALASDLQNRASGINARLHGQPLAPANDDAIIDARVRTALGRVSTHPGAVAVGVIDGVVELNGPVLANEHDAIVNAVERTRGVVDVVDHTTLHESDDSIPGLQGSGSMPPAERMWPTAAILCAAAGSAGVIAYSLRRR